MPAVLDSFARLARDADIVLVEGAGSPAEINLRAGDIANMGFAAAADVPVLLAGDIDRGGVIASLVGTHAVLEPSERARIRGFLINKFRGDSAAVRRRRRGDRAAHRLAVVSASCRGCRRPRGCRPRTRSTSSAPARSEAAALKVVVPMLSRIANFDDLDPLGMEPGVELVFVPPGEPIAGDADVVILPGSKSTIGDLAFLRAQGWDIDIKAHARRGGHVLGLCGGYQMLGRIVRRSAWHRGTGRQRRRARPARRRDRDDAGQDRPHPVQGRALRDRRGGRGYEIHLGRTEGPDCARPMLTIAHDPEKWVPVFGKDHAQNKDRPDGAASRDGRVRGTYVHGLFTSDEFRRAWLAQFRGRVAARL